MYAKISYCVHWNIPCHPWKFVWHLRYLMSWWLMPWKAYGKMTFSARIPGRQGGLCLAQPTGTAQSFPLFESFASNLNMLRFLSHISKSSLKHFQRQKLAKFFKLPLWRPVKHGTEFKKRKTHTEKKKRERKTVTSKVNRVASLSLIHYML